MCVCVFSVCAVVTTLAGNGVNAYADGNGTQARFTLSYAVAADASGNVYIAGSPDCRIRKVSPIGGTLTNSSLVWWYIFIICFERN